MPTPYQRRREDPGYDAEASLVRKVIRSPVFDKVAYAVVAALLGGTASVATRKVEDAGHEAIVAATREELLGLKAELERRSKTLHDRITREETEREQREREAAREERALDRYLERRLAAIEAALHIQAPPAPAEARDGGER